MGLCPWSSQWRWDMGLSLMVSSVVPGKAQRPGSISQLDVDKQKASSPTPACEQGGELLLQETLYILFPQAGANYLAFSPFLQGTSSPDAQGSLSAGKGVCLLPDHCMAAASIPS